MPQPPAPGRFDVCGVGSALVDVLVEAMVADVEACGLVKGSMQLMDLATSERVHATLASGGLERSGGSAANTIAGIAGLGARAAFIGRVADDRFGKVFAGDLAEQGVTFGAGPRAGSAEWATGRCLILVTPDADRTMCTTLGVAAHLGTGDLDHDLISEAQITYLEGYLWDEPVAIAALRAAIATAHAAGRRVALSLSDPFCVGRHRTAWQQLVATDIDIVFGNEAELCSLMDVVDLQVACERVRRPGLLVTITRGALGAWTFSDADGPVLATPAHPVDRVVDTTGAGDLYAAGFLFGLTAGLPLETCARYGAIAAAEVISHIGARPEADLAALLAAGS